MDVHTLTLTELRQLMVDRQISAVEATTATLDRIAQLNGQYGACRDLFSDRALQRAREVDAGQLTGPLAGMPITIKDNICTRFGHTTCGSRMLEDYRSPFDATAVAKLESAGAIIIAKTNMDEFAMGSSTEHSAFGPTRNPWDMERVPGGSSGGAAAAVAAGFGVGAIGSDTGGSIRQPAAFCGVVGMKPTYGLVSRYGLVAYGSSLDQIGPLGRTVADVAELLNVICGHDPLDSTSNPEPCDDLLADLSRPIASPRIGIARQYLSDANSAAVRQAMDRAVDAWEQLGAEIVEVDLPHTEYGIPTYYIIATAEASSNLARYDGIHYGRRAASADDLVDLYAASRAEGFGPEVQRRIMLGTYALSSGYYDAYYLRAMKVRRLIKQDFDAAFSRCDAILCPVATDVAFRAGEKTSDPLAMYLNDVYTVTANLAGIPGISLCCGRNEQGLPVGLQLLGPAMADARLLRLAQMLESTAGIKSEPIPTHS